MNEKRILNALLTGALEYYGISRSTFLAKVNRGERPAEGVQNVRGAYLWACDQLGIPLSHASKFISLNGGNSVRIAAIWRGENSKSIKEAVVELMRVALINSLQKQEK